VKLNTARPSPISAATVLQLDSLGPWRCADEVGKQSGLFAGKSGYHRGMPLRAHPSRDDLAAAIERAGRLARENAALRAALSARSFD
jgi:hypothetical protein